MHLLLLDLRLLFFESVNENGGKAVILNPFDFTPLIMCDKQWLDGSNVFRSKAQVSKVIAFPTKGERFETIDNGESTSECL